MDGRFWNPFGVQQAQQWPEPADLIKEAKLITCGAVCAIKPLFIGHFSVNFDDFKLEVALVSKESIQTDVTALTYKRRCKSYYVQRTFLHKCGLFYFRFLDRPQ